MDKYAAALAGCPRLGSKHMRELIEYFHIPENVWKASDDDIRQSQLLKGKTLESFFSWRHETEPDRIEEEMYQKGVRSVTFEEEDYPYLLRNTINPPAVLFYKGTLPADEKMMAIVGSRKATSYGIQTAGNFASGLAAEGVTIVSGGARGIDSAAHRGALRSHGKTVVVAAFGLDRVYPPENRNLFAQIIEEGGALISEYPLGTPPLGRQFPARNRIIAGLCRGVIVVEAAERSGSLITSDFALEEGRDVFSVPGSIYIPSCAGTNQLIRNGAICCTSFENVLAEYGWNKKEEKKEKIYLEQLTLQEELVYRFCCTENEVTAEEIIQQSGLSVVTVTMVLLQLQLKGYIKETGPGRYMILRS